MVYNKIGDTKRLHFSISRSYYTEPVKNLSHLIPRLCGTYSYFPKDICSTVIAGLIAGLDTTPVTLKSSRNGGV
ncbi:hypothetical protein BGZ54_000344, partial [Gamsiella multidivaricata]